MVWVLSVLAAFFLTILWVEYCLKARPYKVARIMGLVGYVIGVAAFSLGLGVDSD